MRGVIRLLLVLLLLLLVPITGAWTEEARPQRARGPLAPPPWLGVSSASVRLPAGARLLSTERGDNLMVISPDLT